MKTLKRNKRKLSLLLAIIVLFAQVVLLSNFTFAETPTNLVCTISPSAVDVSSSAKRITVTASSGTPFTTGQATPYLLNSDGTDSGALISSVSSATTQQVSFTIGTGLTSGTYTVRIVDPKGTYNCGTLSVGTAALSLTSPTSVSKGYNQTDITLYGQNTNFQSGTTTVKILDGSNAIVQNPTVSAVTSSTELTFTLRAGLNSGIYTIIATTGEEVATGSSIFTVRGTSSITLSSSALNEGYSNTNITVTGTDTGFTDATTVQLISDTDKDGVVDTGEEATGKAGSPNVASATSLTFSVNSGLSAGKYIVIVKTGDESASAALTVAEATGQVQYSSSELTSIPAGYTSSYTLTFKGTNTNFQSGTTTLKLYNSSQEDKTTEYVSSTSVSSSTVISFTLGTGLPAGIYTVKAATGDQTIEDTFEVKQGTVSLTYNSAAVESGTHNIPAGYLGFQVNLAGTGTLFQDNTTVKVLDDSDVEVANKITSKTTTSATAMSFNLAAGLTAGTYKFKIDMDGNTSTTTDIIYQSFTVTSSSITSVLPSNTVVTTGESVSVKVIGQNTKFSTAGSFTVDFTGVPGETATYTSASELDDDDNTEQIVFSFVPNSTIFTESKAYPFTLSINTGAIVDTVSGSITVNTKGIALSSNTIYSNNLGTKSMTITGKGTGVAFDTIGSKTEVYIDDTLITATVSSSTQIAFTMPAGLSNGTHELKVVEDNTINPPVEYTTNFLVIERSISASPKCALSGYSGYNVGITAKGITFDTSTNKPSISIIGSGGTDAVSLANEDITSTSTLSFDFPASKPSGVYTVRLTWNAGNYSGISLDTTCYVAPIAPTPSFPTGIYNCNLSITLTQGSTAANTYYTIDGNDPTSSSTPYTVAIPITANEETPVILKAVSYDSAGNKGSQMQATYTFDTTGPLAPTVSVDDGTYDDDLAIAITTPTDAAITYYTTTGEGEPTVDNENKHIYTGAFTITALEDQTIVLKTRSYDSAGNAGAMTTKTYVFNSDALAAPTASVDSGSYKEAFSVTLTPTNGSEHMYYTTDGTEPTNDTSNESIHEYTETSDPIAISGSNGDVVTLKAVCYDSGRGFVMTKTYTFDTVVPEMPTVDIGEGTYGGVKTVTITPPTDAANTYYALGTEPVDPDNSATAYTDSIEVDGNNGETIILKAVSYDAAGNKSSVLSVNYTFDKQGPAAPTANKSSGVYNSSQSVLLTLATDAANTYYTTNGIDPNSSNSKYTGAVVVNGGNGESVIFKAASYDTYGNRSDDVLAVTFTFDKVGPAEPIASVDSGVFSSAFDVTLTLDTDADSTYYTIDGSTPTKGSTAYTVPVNISDDVIFKAISYDDVGNASSVMEKEYEFNTSITPTPTSTPSNNYVPPIISSPTPTSSEEVSPTPTSTPTPTGNVSPTPTTISLYTPKPVEIISIKDNLQIVKNSETGGSIIEISKEIVENALTNVSTDKKLELKIEIPKTDTLKQEIKLDIDVLEKVASEEADVNIVSGDSELKISSEIIKEFKTQDVDIEVNITTLTQDETKVVEEFIPQNLKSNMTLEGPVIDFTINSVKDSIKTEVTKLKEDIRIKIKVDIPNETDAKKLGMYYLNSENNWIYIPFSKYEADSKVVTAPVNHLTKFTVMKYSKTFKDVNQDDWYEKYISPLVSKYIINGMTDETFEPDTSLRRSEFTKLIATALNLEFKEYQGTFNDVKESDWHWKYIEAVAREGIVIGTGSGKFSPDSLIDRQQMAKIIMKACEYQTGQSADTIAAGASDVFSDQSDIASWAQVYVKAAYQLGIVNGMGDGTYNPEGNALRSHAAKVIYELLAKLELI